MGTDKQPSPPSKQHNLTEYEKIVYRISKDINYDLLYGEINKLIKNNLDISSSILNLIRSQNTELSKMYFDIVLKYNANRTKNKINNDEMSVEEMSAEEETNLKVIINQEKRVVISYSPYPGTMKDVVYFYATYKDGIINRQVAEVDDIGWYDITEALDIITYEMEKNVLIKLMK